MLSVLWVIQLDLDSTPEGDFLLFFLFPLSLQLVFFKAFQDSDFVSMGCFSRNSTWSPYPKVGSFPGRFLELPSRFYLPWPSLKCAAGELLRNRVLATENLLCFVSKSSILGGVEFRTCQNWGQGGFDSCRTESVFLIVKFADSLLKKVR